MTIEWKKPTIDWYVDKLKNNEQFSVAGYSDAEWYSILGKNEGVATGLGQIMNQETGDKLLDILKRRQNDPTFLVAAPDCMWYKPEFVGPRIDKSIEALLEQNDINLTLYERDIVTDNLARDAGLYPFINQLQKMSVHIVGNKDLRKIDFLNYELFTEISSPNCHMEERGVENAVNDILTCDLPGVYLVSAGMSAALIIDQVHENMTNSWFIDVGSMWDAFVGIGGQRKWRAALYKNPEKLAEWKNANLTGANYERLD